MKGEAFTAGWLACWQERPAFIGILFRDTSATLKASQCQVGVCVCVHPCERKEVTALPAAFLQWWAAYVQTQTNEASPRNLVANSPSSLYLSGESRPQTYAELPACRALALRPYGWDPFLSKDPLGRPRFKAALIQNDGAGGGGPLLRLGLSLGP